MADFSERLKKIRHQFAKTQSDVSIGTGITMSTLSKYENGRADRAYDYLIRIARFFDVSTDYLLGLSDEMRHAGENAKGDRQEGDGDQRGHNGQNKHEYSYVSISDEEKRVLEELIRRLPDSK